MIKVRQARSFAVLTMFLLLPVWTLGQQTLGSMNGTVTDISGGVLQSVAVRIRNQGTNLEVTTMTKDDGSFSAADLPIGNYEVTFAKDGFEKAVHPQIVVQGNRTTTVNARLHPGEVSSTVTVNGTPLLNATDTTTGYILSSLQIDNLPLGTGSFTQLAILSPGVDADLLNTSGTNAGFGNQSIWANGQRDSSNSFSFNGVYANNVFNGKSSSQVTSGRVAVNIGESSNQKTGEIQTSTSIYGAIGQALPSPPPETIQELRVNSAMYDASQGANSGAHIEVMTKAGTNDFHGGAWEYHQSTGFDANPWFNKNVGLDRPPLHRNVFGGMIGGPVKRDKLFFFASYQGQRVTDQLLGTSLVAVPVGLTKDRSDAGLIAAANSFISPDPTQPCGTGTQPSCFSGTIDPIARKLLTAKAPDGTLLIPSAVTNPTQLSSLEKQNAEAIIQGPASHFVADQVNGNIDYIFSSADRLAAKYYFQRDPNSNPFASSQVLGFPQTMNAGSQVISLDNTTILNPNLSWEQRFGFIRERAYAGSSQFLNPGTVGITLPGTNFFPQIAVGNMDSVTFTATNIGPSNNFANAGIFQNGFDGATNLNWVHGKHTISTGFSLDYSQLNVINKDASVARLNFADFLGFLQGQLCSSVNSCGSGASASELFAGTSNRYFRSRQVGVYVQDDFRIRPNITVDVGLRWDWDGPLYEKNGKLTNFYPKDYSYNVQSDSFGNGGQAIGLVVAGNNKAFGTKGVSDSTLTGRQWGFAPRIGLVYSPAFLKNLVIRAGFGMYYDRGEYFTELSPSAGGGISGPFGVTMEPPFVVPSFAGPTANFAVPFGTTPPPPPPNNLSTVIALVPNARQLIKQTTTACTLNLQFGCGPIFFGGYDPKNTLPYSENWTLDLQWQPVNTLLLSLAYVGNHGVHGVMPIPFNQAQIATPQNPLLAGGPNQQNYSYGWQVPGLAAENVQTIVSGFTTGNAALRVPFIGYDPNSDFNEAIGISHYHSLQASVNKRISHGLLVTASYTWSHALDEQSGLGLFYNGNNPLVPRSGYGNSDFDRTHVFTVSYFYQFPTSSKATGWEGEVVNGWGIDGVTVLESGQPYSVIDFSGAVAGIYWQGQNFITNPIVPVGGAGSVSKQPNLQGTTGINALNPVLNAAAFGPPQPFAPGTNGVPPCETQPSGPPICDNFETGYATANQRNIFRGPFQNRFDFGVFKQFKLSERFTLKYDAQFFNLFNHPSFDIPQNQVIFAPDFQNPPIYGTVIPNADTRFNPCIPSTGAFACPPKGNLGQIQHTIGSPRFVQMALHLTF
jgi:hypothetical protein